MEQQIKQKNGTGKKYLEQGFITLEINSHFLDCLKIYFNFHIFLLVILFHYVVFNCVKWLCIALFLHFKIIAL